MGQALTKSGLTAAAASEAIIAAVSRWPGVTTDEGPAEASVMFRFRRQVLGHVYAGCGEHAAVDAVFPPTMGEALIALGRGSRHPVVPDAGWVFKIVGDEDDIAAAIALLRDNYDRIASRLRLVQS